MAPVLAPKTLSLSPCSPPRKKAKFSLRLKGKKTKNEEEEERDYRKVHPIFSSPSQDENYDGNNLDQEPEIPSLPYTGLLNQGNTCYANAVLQVLRCCPGFEQLVGYLANKEKVMNEEQSRGNEKRDETEEVISQLEELLCQMGTFEEDFLQDKENCIHLSEKGNNLVLAAETLKFMEAFRELYPAFECNLQHDAQEFLCSLIMALQESATSKAKRSTNYVNWNQTLCQPNDKSNKAIKSKATTDKNGALPHCMEHMFQGKLVHQTKCLNCEESKLRYEDFQDVSVPVVEDQPYLDARRKLMLSPTPKKYKESIHTLQWAIGQFASSECLQGDNKYFCENCNTYCEAEIRTCFDELPGILTIHLKRFTSSVGLSSKITSNLQTPFVLSVQEWCSKKCQVDSNVYELFGIVIHSGMTSGSGHYETYVRLIKDQNRKSEQNRTASSNEDVQSKKETKHNANGFEEKSNEESFKNHVSCNGDAPKMDVNGNCIFDESKDRLRPNGKSKRKRSRKSENGNLEIENDNDVAEKSPESRKDVKRKKVGENSELEEESRLERQGQRQTTCMSVITRYFQRSRKITSSNRLGKCPKNPSNSENDVNSSKSVKTIHDTIKENGFEVEESEEKLKETPASNEKPKGYRSIENYFKKAASCKSDGKILVKSPAIRKLRFHGNSEEELVCNGNSNSREQSQIAECQSSSSDEECQITGSFEAYDESLKNGWVHFDDCTVASLSEQDILSILSSSDSSFTSPYLLFYRKIKLEKQ